jgi:DNA-binding transcriptional LysR family regulator
MKITLHQLQIFRKVAELKSVTKAAEALHMTQPAVSNMLRLLNEALGSPVIEVLNKKIYLTHTGQVLLDASAEINQVLAEVVNKINLQKGIVSGQFRIASVSTAKYFVLRLLGAFKKHYPAVQIQLCVKNRNEILQRLQQNADDFVIMSQLPDNIQIDHQPFYADELIVAAPAERRAQQKNLSLSDLQKEAWLLREPGSGTRMAVLNLFKKYRFTPRVAMELDNNESIKQAIISNMGISILSKQSIELEAKIGLIKILPVKGFPVPYEWFLVKPHGKILSPIAQQFYDFARLHPEVVHFQLKK